MRVLPLFHIIYPKLTIMSLEKSMFRISLVSLHLLAFAASVACLCVLLAKMLNFSIVSLRPTLFYSRKNLSNNSCNSNQRNQRSCQCPVLFWLYEDEKISIVHLFSACHNHDYFRWYFSLLPHSATRLQYHRCVLQSSMV